MSRAPLDRTVVGFNPAFASSEEIESKDRHERDQREALMTGLALLGFAMSTIQFIDSRKGR